MKDLVLYMEINVRGFKLSYIFPKWRSVYSYKKFYTEKILIFKNLNMDLFESI